MKAPLDFTIRYGLIIIAIILISVGLGFANNNSNAQVNITNKNSSCAVETVNVPYADWYIGENINSL
jgi:hypothetical protein